MSTDPGAPNPFVVKPFQAADAARWDDFVRLAPTGTFLHTRRYLEYHRERFEDLSVLVETDAGVLVAVLPAAVRPGQQSNDAISHPGLTFGGLVYNHALKGDRLVLALEAVLAEFGSRGFSGLDYRPVPAFARRQLGSEDVHAAFRLGGQRTTCQLSAVVDIAYRRPIDGKKRNVLRKAERSGVAVSDGMGRLSDFWSVLSDELSRRHGATPVHSIAEMTELAGLFPDEIALRIAETAAGDLVAGALTYRYSSDVIHTQYLTSNDQGRQFAALDLVCQSIIEDATVNNVRYVSFGPSTHEDGRVLNDSLYRFKHSFGAEGVVVEAYRIPCRVS
jgi:Acetyltransferase (GNAT) domain